METVMRQLLLRSRLIENHACSKMSRLFWRGHIRYRFVTCALTVTFLVILICLPSAWGATCTGGANLPTGNGEDLEVTGKCYVLEGETYHYGDVNIYKGGSLIFDDPHAGQEIHFWAKSILVEKDSSLIVGTPDLPIGCNCQAARDHGEDVYCGRLITIHLYGEDQGAHPFGTSQGMGGKGITCKTDDICGVPADLWTLNPVQKTSLPGGVSDYFYAYAPLPYDDGDPKGYFGYKVLAVSYGGTLQLFGRKGATNDADRDPDPSYSGTSWVRLAKDLPQGGNRLVLDRRVDPQWEPGDKIVVTTTDYLPGHSEELTIDTISSDGKTITVKEAAQYFHSGMAYNLGEKDDARLAGSGHPGIGRLNLGIKTNLELTPGGAAVSGQQVAAADTRAAVALLTRGICIQSEGGKYSESFPNDSYFGGHTVIRQGIQSYQIQGVEFSQMGQGGRMGHYPIHFHMTRKTPANTFVKDCSINESMTRWITIHGTQDVTLARNVGYKSIGHGYYLEDGTEINNKLYSNLGIFARAAIDNPQNPRKVPGILAGGNQGASDFPYNSDFSQPTVFWIMNGWNDFEYNMAAGAGACGACYWLVPGANSGMSKNRKWESYASMQKGESRAATTPLKLFRGNYATTAMNSFNTVGATDTCLGLPELGPVPNTLVPIPTRNEMDMYYPITAGFGDGGGRFPTRCDGVDCSTVTQCSNGDESNCMVTVLDRYTSAFHWTETNFAAIWLRPQWYLVINSVLSDVQNGGLSFVTGGDYTASNFLPGQWMLARKNAFIGHTQESNPYASNAGPFNPDALSCADGAVNRCYSKAEGISMPLSSFGNCQRLFNIYDGPAYQETNAFLDITTTPITDCPAPNPNQQCNNSEWMYGKVMGMRRMGSTCYLPNAAIGWKQPNGFYYPPAFHSTNLFFDNVDIRHFVIEPKFIPGTFKTTDDLKELQEFYCTWNPAMFEGFTGIDRQTELSDDDGSLTGLVNTISVNEDSFFDAPIETIECRSDETTKTSPYEYATTVVYPDCASAGSTSPCNADPVQPWDSACSNQFCYGVPLFRQFLKEGEQAGTEQEIRMAGMNFYQRSNLTVDHGVYYIDTTAGTAKQAEQVCVNRKNPLITPPIDCTDPVNIGKTVGDFPNTAPSEEDKKLPACNCNLNVFRGGQTYNVFLLYAKPNLRQTYNIYVGTTGFNKDTDVKMVRADISTTNVLPIESMDFPDTAKDLYPWSRDYKSGILTVTIDLRNFKSEFDDVKKDLCQPASFCSWNGKECVCNEALNDPTSPLYNPALYKDCTEKTGAEGRTICSWAGNDIDCPDGRCFGFSFKLPDAFMADSVDERPTPVPFETAKADWCLEWKLAGSDLAGACYHPDFPLKPDYCTDEYGLPEDHPDNVRWMLKGGNQHETGH